MSNKTRIQFLMKDYTMLLLGLTMFSIGFTAFILPNKIVIGGLVGIGTILNLLYGIKVWEFNTLVNVVLLIIALKIMGREFVLKTIVCVVALSVTMAIGEEYISTFMATHRPIGNTFIEVIIAVIMLGSGLGMVYAHNGSTGGVDIIGFLMMRLFNINLSVFMTILNCTIIAASYFILPQEEHSLERTAYGLILIPLLWGVVHWVIKLQRK